MDKIANSRREGKNRRDGATVSTRVVRLTDMLGQKLFDDATRPEAKAKGGVSPTLSSEDALVFNRNVAEGKRRRSLEKRARL